MRLAGQTLAIRWHRLVDAQGRTCARSVGPERELEWGVKALRERLKPRGLRAAEK